MGKFVGIDLGTTNSVAAFFFKDVQVVSAKDNSIEILTRSVVAFSQGKLIVGEEAYNQLLKGESENVIMSIKRLMGRSFSDPVIAQQQSHLSYKITQSSQGTENSLSVWLAGKEYEPEDISAEILKKVVQNAQIYQQNQLGQTGQITEAVITIPAYFNDKQRDATKNAAKRAGLIVRELLPEPTAAAISYGFKPDSDDVKTILVYDFGGGTFDSSVITVSGNTFVESGKAGDLWLGGDDIDNRIIELVKQKVAKEEDLDDIDDLIARMPQYQRVSFLGDLKMTVEQAKITLSSVTEAKILPATPLLDDLGMIYIDVVITRSEFEEMIFPLVERTIAVCRDAIKYSDYPEDMIDTVLLVGGSSQIPLVQRKVREAFGTEKVVVHPRPMSAIAEGAAIVGAGLAEKISTVSRNYYIELINDLRHLLIKQGEILPIKTTHTFKTEFDGQRVIHYKLSNSDLVKEDLDKSQNNEPIGQMWLALDEFYPQGTEVLVTVELDEQNSALQITAALKNDPSIKVSSSFSRGGRNEKIYKKVEEEIQKLNQEGNLTPIGVEKMNQIAGEVVRAANQILNEDGTTEIDRLEIAENKLKELEIFASDDYDSAKFFISSFKFATEECGDLLPDTQKERLERLTVSLEESIKENNLSAIQYLSDNAQQEYENLPDIIHLSLFNNPKQFVVYKRFTTFQVNQTEANAMAIKFDQIMKATKRDNINESKRVQNPYDILGVSSAASKAEITKAFMLAMKRKEYPVDVIAHANKSLMNPEKRIIADYLRPILPAIERFKCQDLSGIEILNYELDLLDEFDNLDIELTIEEQASELDKKLGLSIFSSSLIIS